MNERAIDIETLLRQALTPVDPPEDLVERLETTLEDLTALAADELEAWELSAMRDPRNWVRPAAAVVVGGAAATTLVLLQARRRAQLQRRSAPSAVPERFERALRDAARQAGRALERSARR